MPLPAPVMMMVLFRNEEGMFDKVERMEDVKYLFLYGFYFLRVVCD